MSTYLSKAICEIEYPQLFKIFAAEDQTPAFHQRPKMPGYRMASSFEADIAMFRERQVLPMKNTYVRGCNYTRDTVCI